MSQPIDETIVRRQADEILEAFYHNERFIALLEEATEEFLDTGRLSPRTEEMLDRFLEFYFEHPRFEC